MPTVVESSSSLWALSAYMGGVVFLLAFMLGVPVWLGGRDWGDVAPQRLLLAYSQGIFPWPAQGAPLLWFTPVSTRRR